MVNENEAVIQTIQGSFNNLYGGSIVSQSSSNFRVFNSSVFSNIGYIYINGTQYNNVRRGQLAIDSSILNNTGKIDSSGTIIDVANSGTFNNLNGGLIINENGNFINSHDLATIYNFNGGVISNIKGSLIRTLVVTSSGGTIINDTGGIIYNNSDSTLLNDNVSIFTNNGIIYSPTSEVGCGLGFISGKPIDGSGIIITDACFG